MHGEPLSSMGMEICTWLVVWMLFVGMSCHLGPRLSHSNRRDVEFLNVGGWLSHRHLALGSKAHFQAVAEHRLVPARVRTVSSELWRAQIPSVLEVTVCTSSPALMLHAFYTPIVNIFVVYGYQGS